MFSFDFYMFLLLFFYLNEKRPFLSFGKLERETKTKQLSVRVLNYLLLSWFDFFILNVCHCVGVYFFYFYKSSFCLKIHFVLIIFKKFIFFKIKKIQNKILLLLWLYLHPAYPVIWISPVLACLLALILYFLTKCLEWYWKWNRFATKIGENKRGKRRIDSIKNSKKNNFN